MNIFGIISFMGVTIGLLSSLDVLVDDKSRWTKFNSFLLFFSAAFLQLEWTCWFFGYINYLPAIQMLNIPFNLLIGPLFYFYLKNILHANWKMSPGSLLPYFPSVFSTIVIIPYFFLDTNTQVYIKLVLDNNISIEHPYAIIIELFRYFIFTQTIVYLFYFCYKTRIIFNFKSLFRESLVLHLLILAVITFATSIFGLLTELFLEGSSYVGNFKIISSIVFILQIYLHLILHAYPNSAKNLRDEIKKVKYENSNLKNLDLMSLKEQFLDLFENQKLYQNDTLKLEDIARKLGIGTHKTSQFINEVFQLSFYELVNKYRIEDAEELLLKEPSRNVLNIALYVGFNNSSTFYSAFTKKWKMSPNQFRKKK